jgi:hypothetical protein
MKRIRLLGLMLLAVFALSAVAATSAFAEEEPIILPTPTPTAPLTFTGVSEGETILQGTAEASKVKCLKAPNTGEFTSAHLGKVTVDFEECKLGASNCSSAGDAAGTILLTNADVHLVDILPGSVLTLGLLIIPLEGGKNVFKFKCGIVTEEVLGGVIGTVFNGKGEALKTLEKAKLVLVLWKQVTQGMQDVTACMTPAALCGGAVELKSSFGLGEELSAEIAHWHITFAKEVEVHF